MNIPSILENYKIRIKQYTEYISILYQRIKVYITINFIKAIVKIVMNKYINCL